MRHDQELSIDQLSTVLGGTTSNSGSMSHPRPSPADVLIKWILGKLT